MQGTGGASRAERRQAVRSSLPHSRDGERSRRLSLGRTIGLASNRRASGPMNWPPRARWPRPRRGKEDARGAAASRVTVEKLIDLYLRRRVVGRLRTAKSIESRLRRTLAPIVERYAADICRRDIRGILGQHRRPGQRSRSGKASGRFAPRCSAERCRRTSSRRNPPHELEAYDRGTPRDRVLSVEEIETLWRWLKSDALSLEAADILKLELLTGARCGEIRSAFALRRSSAINGFES